MREQPMCLWEEVAPGWAARVWGRGRWPPFVCLPHSRRHPPPPPAEPENCRG